MTAAQQRQILRLGLKQEDEKACHDPHPRATKNAMHASARATLSIASLLALTSLAGAQEPVGAPIQQTVTVLERVVPRACLLSVQLKDPAQCHIKAINLAPNSECRGTVGDDKFVCSGFTIQLDGPGCTYVVKKRPDCENIAIKKVSPQEKP
jgi:hypothetical protein